MRELFRVQSSGWRAVCHFKHLLFFLYIVSFPIREVPKIGIFLLAHIVSLAQRKFTHTKDSFLTLILSDEESMHFFWFLAYMLLNWQVKYFVDLMFLMWAYVNTCEWFDYIILTHPGVPILPLLTNLVQTTQDNTIAIVKLKSYIEVLLVPVTLIAWMFGWCAPIIGVILVQSVRIKFLSNSFTKNACRGYDSALQQFLPALVYTGIVSPIKSFLCSLSGIKESIDQETQLKAKKNDAAKNDGTPKRQRLAKKLSTVEERQEEGSSDEPKTYEIADSNE